MLIVPMPYEDRVHGVIVVSQLGLDRFGADDETTLSIFAGYAAQALVNAETLDQVRRQQRGARAPARQPAPPARGQRAAPLDARPDGRPRDDRGLPEDRRLLRLADDLPDRPDRGRPPGRRRPRPLRRGDPRATRRRSRRA